MGSVSCFVLVSMKSENIHSDSNEDNNKNLTSMLGTDVQIQRPCGRSPGREGPDISRSQQGTPTNPITALKFKLMKKLTNQPNILHSRKLTWNLKMMVSNRNLLFQVSIFGCHVSFRECNINSSILFPLLQYKQTFKQTLPNKKSHGFQKKQPQQKRSPPQ